MQSDRGEIIEKSLHAGADLVSLSLYCTGCNVINTASFHERIFINISNVLSKDKIVCKQSFKGFSPCRRQYCYGIELPFLDKFFEAACFRVAPAYDPQSDAFGVFYRISRTACICHEPSLVDFKAVLRSEFKGLFNIIEP